MRNTRWCLPRVLLYAIVICRLDATSIRCLKAIMKYQGLFFCLLVLPAAICTPRATAQQPHKTITSLSLPLPSATADSTRPQIAAGRLIFDGHSFAGWEGE